MVSVLQWCRFLGINVREFVHLGLACRSVEFSHDLCGRIPPPLTSFDTLGLSAPLLQAIQELGFETPTDIQAQAIPMLLEGGRDFIGLAQTGTGKTAAFGLPLLDHLDASQRHVQALVLAPTRELGQQIAEQLGKFAKHKKGLRTVAVYGGANIVTQMRELKSPRHVVIATPGRLIDLIKRKAVHLDQISHLILDEADEMLNMGFKEELDTILEYTPDSKNTWLFSATMPKEIRRMVGQYMTAPLEVRVNQTATVNKNIEHKFAVVRHADKTEALARFLDLDPNLYGVVFCRTRRDTQSLAEELLKRGYRADALHGEMSQAQRDRVMQRFKEKHLQVLVATDVAARGIDVDNLSHVFHHSLPSETAYYTHRSGRTARAGKKGISLVFMSGRERGHIDRLSRTLDISFEQAMVPSPQEIVHSRLTTWGQGLVGLTSERPIPEDIWEQMELLFGAHSKEDLLRQVVLAELQRLNVGAKKDLNQPSHGGGDRSSHRNDRWDKGNRGERPFRKKKSFAKKKYQGGGGSGSWDNDRPGKPVGAGKAKRKHKAKKGAFKPGPGGEPWKGTTTGRPGFGVKGKKK